MLGMAGIFVFNLTEIWIFFVNFWCYINKYPTYVVTSKFHLKRGLKHQTISKSHSTTTILTMHINFSFILYISMNKSSIMHCIKIFSQQQYEKDKKWSKEEAYDWWSLSIMWQFLQQSHIFHSLSMTRFLVQQRTLSNIWKH